MTSAVALGAVVFASFTAGSSGAARAADPRIGWRLASDAAVTTNASAAHGGENASRVTLPRAPRPTFQVRLAPPILGELTTDARGRLLVAHGSDRLTLLDAQGKTVWSVRLGTALASGPLAISPSRTLLVARDGRLFEVTPAGVASERESLPWSELEGTVVSAPTGDGGAILAVGARLARLGTRGTRGFQTKVASAIRAVFSWRGATLAVGRDGTVWLRGSAGGPNELASFGEPLSQVRLVGDQLLGLAGHALVALDLATKRRAVLFTDAADELHDLAIASDGRLSLVAGRAMLVELAQNGHELGRVSLPTAESGVELASVLVDQNGTRYVSASGAPLLAVTPQGDISAVAGTGCPDPLRLAPLANGHLVAACRSGLLAGLSDTAR